jgi:ribosome-associated translation inhibitor RaiA
MVSQDNKKLPFYIVGLPDNPIEASEAQMKFERLSRELVRAFPFVEEIRAVVKSKKPTASHARYEVSVDVYTPKGVHSFSETGYNVASVFDAIAPKVKRILSSKQSRVTASHGESRRKQI